MVYQVFLLVAAKVDFIAVIDAGEDYEKVYRKLRGFAKKMDK